MNQILEVVNTSPALVLAGGGVFAVILLLLFIVMRQGKQINKLELQAKPQYGFLGKPLYAVMIMALVAGGVGITLYSQGSLAPDDTSATKEVVAEISVTVIEPGIPEDRVQFSAVPMVGELEWGEPNDIFDLVWTINGPKISLNSNLSAQE